MTVTLRKIAAALAAAAVILSALTSCALIINEYDETPAAKTEAYTGGDGTYAEITTSAPPVGFGPEDVTAATPDLVSPLSGLPDRDFSDSSLTVAVMSETVSAVMPDESSPFYAACVMRSDAVTAKYGTIPQFLYYTRTEITEGIKKTNASGAGQIGDFYADVVEMPAAASGVLALSGQLINLYTLPFYSAPEGGSASAGSLIGRLWFEISDTTDDPGALLLLLCRRDATEDGCKSLYSAALSGEFTFEFFLTEAAKMTPEGSDGKILSVSDATDAGILGEAAVLRSGLTYTADITKGRELSWTKGDNKAYLTDLIPRIAAITCTAPADAAAEYNPLGLFNDGQAKFYVCPLEEVDAGLYSGKTDFALLPLPYGDSPQTGVAIRKNVLCVPVINRRSEMTGLCLNAYRALSGQWIRDSYLPRFASEQMRDNDSYYTLKIILEERAAVDFGEIMCDSIRDLGKLTFEAARGAMTSENPLGEVTDKAVTALNKLLAQNRK